MTQLSMYQNDGGNHQARAVLAFLQGFPDIEESWDEKRRRYEAEINVAKWENCREQGYVLFLRSKDYKRQLNIIFYEHRNSDCICAVKWEQNTMNSPTIDTAEFGEVYKDKYDTSFDVNYGEISKMANWISNEFREFWISTSVKESKNA